MDFDLTKEDREEVWQQTIELLEAFYENTGKLNTSAEWNRDEVIKGLVSGFDGKIDVREAVRNVIENLSLFAVHTPHPDYFGLFNPRPSFPSILGDTITATLNPQMAAWSHSPFASEVESFLIREFGKKFGYRESEVDGVFASGGAEANLTAVLCAINEKFPGVSTEGVKSIESSPRIYCTVETHHTLLKAARICGLGSNSIVEVALGDGQRMDPADLRQKIKLDLSDGHRPFLIFATLGTTGGGSIDPIDEIAETASEFDCWLHADAAYGGALALTGEYRGLLAGIGKADSITFDAHKWLSIPMGAGMFFTRHSGILGKTFRITTDYMPNDEADIMALGSYTHSIQWSRRFTGLKLYLPMLVFGWDGFEETILHQIKMGQILKKKLKHEGWTIYNDTELPIACFSDSRFVDEPAFAESIAARIVNSGAAWISTYPVEEVLTIRACITNYATHEENLDKLIVRLNEERERFGG